MISAIVTGASEPRRLEATLAALAPAAIDGLVREALLVDVGLIEAVREVAEDAGAGLITAPSEGEGLAAACAAARGPWLLILTSGTRLQAGWEPTARRHIERYPDRAGWFDLARDADGVGARMSEVLAAIGAKLGRPEPRQGLLVPQRCLGEARALDYPTLRRSAGRLRRLGVRALA